jgi:hypothetical protein
LFFCFFGFGLVERSFFLFIYLFIFASLFLLLLAIKNNERRRSNSGCCNCSNTSFFQSQQEEAEIFIQQLNIKDPCDSSTSASQLWRLSSAHKSGTPWWS